MATCYRLNRDTAWNPARRYPRNAPCFCGKTDKKFKNCCWNTMGLAIKLKADVANLTKWIKDMRKLYHTKEGRRELRARRQAAIQAAL